MFTMWFAQVVRLDAQSRVLYWHNRCVGVGWVVYIDIVTVPELLPLAAAISRRGASAACLAPSVALLLLGNRIASRRAL